MHMYVQSPECGHDIHVSQCYVKELDWIGGKESVHAFYESVVQVELPHQYHHHHDNTTSIHLISYCTN